MISAFYEHLPAAQAYALAERFECFFTPKSASWLNMIEIEFSALARLCLNRRIPTLERLEKEVLTLIAERDAAQVKINWQFSIQSARSKLNSHYVKVQPDNQKFKETLFPMYLDHPGKDTLTGSKVKGGIFKKTTGCIHRTDSLGWRRGKGIV